MIAAASREKDPSTKPRAGRIDLKALKQSIDLLALVRSWGHEPVRHGSATWKINCPFHEDKDASLIITPGKSLWRCFGCGKGGSAIDFVSFAEGINTGEAIRRLAERSGGLIRPASAAALPGSVPAAPLPASPSTRTPQQQTLLNKAAEFYHKALFQYPEGRAYLKGRGLSEPALLESFRVGYANESIREAIPPEGEILDDLKAVGLLDAQGREHFRDCVVFPILDVQGNVAGLYGRKVGASSKIRHLYLPGPHRGVWNRVGARSYKTLLLTEGILDAATLWQAGYKNALACYGTNGLTEEHLQLFRENQTETVFLVLDGDDAGREAATRMTPRLKGEGLDVFTVALPDGEDPNEFFQRHTAADFDALLQEAVLRQSSGQAARGGKAAVAPQTEEATMAGAEQVETLPDGFRVKFTPSESGKARAYEVRLLEADPRKLRATVKAVTADRTRFHIDTVDLLSARSRKAFIADAAGLYREDPAIITLDMNRLLTRCETHITLRNPASEESAVRVPEEQRKEAERFGRRKDLLEAIAQDIEKAGYVGERANALAAYLCMTSRKMDDPLAFLIVSGSGAGKSALQDAALAFCPPEDLIKVTSLTERALFYKDENSLKHKVLALEELAGAEDAAYAIRNLISSKVLVIESTIKDPVTGRLTTMENRVNGPTAVFQTTTRPDVDPETRSRFLVTTIDESRAQTARILDSQRKAHTLAGFRRKLHRGDVLQRHHAFQRLLRPLPVFNPFADLLTFNDERLLMRRDQPKYLALIDTVAFLRQMQKPVKQLAADPSTGSGQAAPPVDYIEVGLSDIALANEMAVEILGRSLDELSGPGRRLLLLIEDLVAGKARVRGETETCILFTRRELREFTRWSDYQIHHYLTQLVGLEYLVPVAGRNGQQYQYRLVWDGQGKDGERFVLGLKTEAELRKEAGLLGFSADLLE